MQNISTNISTLEKRTHFKLGELSSLFMFYNITISLFYPLNGFILYYFLLSGNVHIALNILGTVRKIPSILLDFVTSSKPAVK